jgi:1-acyl-sn-glycerol-3-phosphate acyltransferase
MKAFTEGAVAARQVVEFLSIASYYHLHKLAGNIIDGDEGVIEQRVSQLLARRLLKHFDLHVEVHGAERVWGLERYCVVSSHASYIDWTVLLGYFPSPVRFIAKKELASFPVIGSYLRLRGVLIDRGKGINAKEAIQTAIEDGQPWPILIFPEGTRSKDGKLQPFKTGGLKILAGAGLPMLPVCILGTFDIMPRYTWHIHTGRRIRMFIGEAVRPDEFPTVDAAITEVERRVRAVHEAESGSVIARE